MPQQDAVGAPQLLFQQAHAPEGFTTLGMTTWDGDPEPVARELLQNCLDAASEAGRDRAEVHFTIRRVGLGEIPGIDAYRHQFEQAEREHGQGATGPARTGIERIRAALDHETTGLLVCRDNGVGLNADRMAGLLGEGSSRKAPEQTGSHGVGHLSAFSASDLRYVLYAGRTRDGGGETRDVASGHAMIASYQSTGPHGYWLQQSTLFDEDPYPSAAPPLIAGELDRVDDTGTVVCIISFNSFRDEASPALALRRAAAVHFLAAVHRDDMAVHVRDADGVESSVDRGELPSLLEPIRSERRASSGFPGEFAYRAWETLEEGTALNIAGAEVRFRSLEGTGARDSRVHVFRNGMWIDSAVRQLGTGVFNGYRPFDAVVLLEEGDLYDLVCGAEGPEHRRIEPKRLETQTQRDKLNSLLRDLRDGLQEQAGEEALAERFTPPDFAVVRGDGLRDAERVRRRRPRPTREHPDDGHETTTTGTGGTGPSGPNGSGRRRGGRRQPVRASPATGRAASLRAALVPQRDGEGAITGLSVRWRFHDERVPEAVGVRVYIPSGSDQTCDQPLQPDWVRIAEIRGMNDEVLESASGEGAVELVVPPNEDGIAIVLASSLPADVSPTLDVVRRPSGAAN